MPSQPWQLHQGTEWTEKGESLAAGRAPKPIFWPTPGLKREPFIAWDSQQRDPDFYVHGTPLLESGIKTWPSSCETTLFLLWKNTHSNGVDLFAFGEEGVGGEAAVVNKNWYVKNEQTKTSTLWFPVIVPRVNIQADHIQINVNVKIKIKIKGLKTSKNHHLKIESQKPGTLKWRAEHTSQTLPNPSNASVATKSQQWKHTHTQSEKQEVSLLHKPTMKNWFCMNLCDS